MNQWQEGEGSANLHQDLQPLPSLHSPTPDRDVTVTLGTKSHTLTSSAEKNSFTVTSGIPADQSFL